MLALTVTFRSIHKSWLHDGFNMWCRGGVCRPGRVDPQLRLPSSLLEGFLLKSWKHSAGTVSFNCPVIFLTYPFLDVLPPHSCGDVPQTSGHWERKVGFSSIALHSWEVGYSLTTLYFFTGELTASSFSPTLFCLEEGQSSSYPLQCFEAYFFFLQWQAESFSRKPGFPKSLSHLWVSAQISALQVFPNYGWQAGVGSLAPAVSTAYTKFYMAVTSCIGRQDSSWDPWLMVPNAQLPQRHLCSWTDTEF